MRFSAAAGIMAILMAAVLAPLAGAADESLLYTAQTLTISSDPGADSFTAGVKRKGVFNVSITGTWSGTVRLQRSFDRVDVASDALATWRDITTYTANTEDMAYEPEGDVYYRIGMANGDYSSGAPTMRLGK